MNLQRNGILLLLFSLLGTSLPAQESVTKNTGIFGVQIPGATTEQPLRRTYLGTHLQSDVLTSGSILDIIGKTISYDVGFHGPIDPEIISPDPPSPDKYYIHVRWGDGRGFIGDIKSFAENEIELEEDVPTFLEQWDGFVVRRHLRLAEVFTPDNSYGFGAGESAAQSDNIVVFNPELQTTEVFYFNSLRSRWEKEGVPENANDHPLRYPYSYYVIRRTSGMIRILLEGLMSEDPVLLPVKTGINHFSIPVSHAATLENLIRTTGDHSIQSGPNASSSDLITLHQASSQNQLGPLYHSTATAQPRWMKVGDPASNEQTQVLDPLTSLTIHRKGPPGYLFLNSFYPASPPYFSLSPNPEPGEAATVTLLRMDLSAYNPSPWAVFSLQYSTDLGQNWSEIDDSIIPFGDPNTFEYWVPLPAGQSRSYYRLLIQEF